MIASPSPSFACLRNSFVHLPWVPYKKQLASLCTAKCMKKFKCLETFFLYLQLFSYRTLCAIVQLLVRQFEMRKY